jgi:hypothetical protein
MVAVPLISSPDLVAVKVVVGKAVPGFPVELCGLGATGMIFYITPTFQFILGFFYYNEPFSIIKLVSFILIWIAVFIYLKDLYEND